MPSPTKAQLLKLRRLLEHDVPFYIWLERQDEAREFGRAAHCCPLVTFLRGEVKGVNWLVMPDGVAADGLRAPGIGGFITLLPFANDAWTFRLVKAFDTECRRLEARGKPPTVTAQRCIEILEELST